MWPLSLNRWQTSPNECEAIGASRSGATPRREATLGNAHQDTKFTILRGQLQETQSVTAFLGERATQVHSLVSAEKEGAEKEGAEKEGAEREDIEQEGESIALETMLLTARLLAKAGEREIVFVAQSLPQLSSEQIYRLWAVADEDSEPMYCGQFRQDDSGTARWEAPDAACTNAPAQLLITLDAPDDLITSAGPLVLQSEMATEREV
ncbi:MAG: anti-sigma factor [Cyanobacteria bacterium J06621_11]